METKAPDLKSADGCRRWFNQRKVQVKSSKRRQGVICEPVEAQDVGLMLPGRELSFDTIAAPAGLATLSF